jgi:glycosyltransferase involved in cell wall biosynthesis
MHSRYLSGAVSGENRVVDDEVALLRDGGHEVHAWTPSVEERGGAGMVRTGIEAVWSRRAATHVRELVRDLEPDVVHAHNMFPALSPAVLRAVEETALVVTLHNYRLMCLPATFLRDGHVCESCLGRSPWRGVVHACYRGSVPASAAVAASLAVHRAAGTFERPDAYLAVSRFVRDKHVAAGMARERISVKPNFTWPSPVRDGAGDYFLFLGRLSAEKGLHTVLPAFRATTSAPLVVVGDGPDADRLKSLAGAGVEFRGAVEPADVPEIVRGARALVAPSTCYEGAPRSILEAYAAGVPVIATEIGGLPEVVDDGASGVLVPPGRAEKWSEAVERLLDDGEARKLGQGAWQLWKKMFGPERGLKNLEDAYARVTGSAPRTPSAVPVATGGDG